MILNQILGTELSNSQQELIAAVIAFTEESQLASLSLPSQIEASVHALRSLPILLAKEIAFEVLYRSKNARNSN